MLVLLRGGIDALMSQYVDPEHAMYLQIGLLAQACT